MQKNKYSSKKPFAYSDVFLSIRKPIASPGKKKKLMRTQVPIIEKAEIDKKTFKCLSDKNDDIWCIEAPKVRSGDVISRAKEIIRIIKTNRTYFRRTLNKHIAELNIVIEPHNNSAIVGVKLPTELLQELGKLGIGVDFAVEIPNTMDRFWRRVMKSKRIRARKYDK